MNMKTVSKIITDRYEKLIIRATEQKKDELLMEKDKIIEFLKQQEKRIKEEQYIYSRSYS